MRKAFENKCGKIGDNTIIWCLHKMQQKEQNEKQNCNVPLRAALLIQQCQKGETCTHKASNQTCTCISITFYSQSFIEHLAKIHLHMNAHFTQKHINTAGDEIPYK